VLLLAHGSPENPDQIPEFLTLRHRRTPAAASGRRRDPPSLFADRFLAARLLDSSASRSTFARVEDAGLRRHAQLEALHRRCGEGDCEPGYERVIAICLAPQNSRTSVGLYRSAVTADGNLPFEMDFVEEWHDQPLLAKAFAEKLRAGWEKASAENGAKPRDLHRAQRSRAHDYGGRSLRKTIQGNRRIGSKEAGLAGEIGPSPSRARACPAAHGSAPR
jgi:protoporphyrin/coproporphyrin ferrochelatase